QELSHFDVQNVVGHWSNRGATAVAFSPDGRSLLTVDLQVRLWELATGRERWRANQPLRDEASGGTFSADGRLVAVGSQRGEVRVLETYTGRLLAAWL